MKYPYRALFVPTTEHADCDGCEAAAKSAAGMARATGSVGAKYRDGKGHAAQVHRMGWISSELAR